MYKKPVLLLSVLILAGGCSLGYQADLEFQNWLSANQTRCTGLYGALPAMSDSRHQQFMQLTFDAYRGQIRSIQFASELGILYPRNRLTIDCLASAFPRQTR